MKVKDLMLELSTLDPELEVVVGEVGLQIAEVEVLEADEFNPEQACILIDLEET